MAASVLESLRESVTEDQLKKLLFSMRKHLKSRGVDVPHSMMLDAFASSVGLDGWRAVSAVYQNSDLYLAEAREILREDAVWVYYETANTGAEPPHWPAWVRLKLTPELLARVRKLSGDMPYERVSEIVLENGFVTEWDQHEELHWLMEELVVTPRSVYLKLYQQDTDGFIETIAPLHHELLAALEARKPGEAVFFIDRKTVEETGHVCS